VPGKSDAKTFISVAISQIETNQQDHIWIGTWDGGIYNYKGKGTGSQQNTFTNYNETSGNAPKTSHNVVSCIRPARNGKIWFGTISGGLNMLEHQIK
jgi:ligand-binding sensor domain-containing protein